MSEAEKKFIKRKADIFKALGHPTRLWIMEKLEKGEACVCEFVNEVDVDFSTISAHLSVLQKAGLVDSEKRGREVYYFSLVPCIYDFMHCIENVIKRQLAETLEMINPKEAKDGNKSVRSRMQKMCDNRGNCAGDS